MAKASLPVAFLITLMVFAISSCQKHQEPAGDPTMNYFPLKLGKFVTYNVDSTIYIGDTCLKLEKKSQIKYAISDTFRDQKKRLSYMMDVYTRAHEGAVWQKSRVILLTPAAIPQQTTTPPPGTPQNTILYSQDGEQFMKVVFPIINGTTWKGNQLMDVNNPEFAYLKNWNYRYQDMTKPYNNGEVFYDNTVTVLENNESVNYPQIDSALAAYHIYSKSVYAYQVGMIYREFTYWTYEPFKNKCVDGVDVRMRAIDHN